jgi:uncharacterized protein (TIGR02246 family)
MRRKSRFIIAGAVMALLAASHLGGQQPQGKESVSDTEAIKEAGKSFLKAYKAGDAKTMAAHWTENGEYFADDGTIIRGRNNIEKAYAAALAKKKVKADMEIEVTSIRFPSKDTAIEEGFFRVQVDKEAPVSNKYSVLHVRDGGKWLMAVVREWPSEGLSVRDIEWLIGDWEAKRDDVEVRTKYQWWGDKSFIRADVTIKQKENTIKGFQMIGRDRVAGVVRCWTFDEDGSFAQATWNFDGKKWIQESAAVLEDGSVLTSVNYLTRIDNDTFTFQSVLRTMNGEPIADIAPVRATRVKSK